MKVHPDADIFPMMPDDEIDVLAEDIKTNGLIHPIIMGNFRWPDADDDEEVLVDGRNRLKACKIAGVKPTFKKLNGEDQKAFILSVNVNRRHMTPGQRAMAVAMIYPKGTPGKKTKTSSETEKVSASRLSYARSVLAYSRPLAQAVLLGRSLDEAYHEVKLATCKINNDTIRLRRLREIRPDLAERVELNETRLDEAEVQAKKEAEARKQQRWAATVNLIDGVKLLDRDAEMAAAIAKDFDPSIVEQRGEVFTPARLHRAAAFLSALAAIMEKT